MPLAAQWAAFSSESNCLAGFTSEQRDSHIGDLAPMMNAQAQNVTRHAANETLNFYDRGVRWDDQRLSAIGHESA